MEFSSIFNGARQHRDLRIIERLIRNQSVALVGNAASLYDKHRDIDLHDVVVRINKGPFVDDPERKSGYRTDILLIATMDDDRYLGAAPHVVYMSPKKRQCLSVRQSKSLYFYPLGWWKKLYTEIGARPSTGCMGIDLLSRMILNGNLYLYGFDFWNTPTSHTGTIWLGPHNKFAEEVFARGRIKPENIIV